jgi:hypothetical protein
MTETSNSTHAPTGSEQLARAADKPPFEEPKLTFIEPKLTPRGDRREVTGFFTTFSP